MTTARSTSHALRNRLGPNRSSVPQINSKSRLMVKAPRSRRWSVVIRIALYAPGNLGCSIWPESAGELLGLHAFGATRPRGHVINRDVVAAEIDEREVGKRPGGAE